MGQLTSRVDRMRRELRPKLDTATLTHADVGKLQPQMAECLLRALGDEGHPLRQIFVELTQMIDAHRAPAQPKEKSPDAPGDEQITMSDRQFFMPQPGNCHAQIRRFWPLQLLLHIVAGYSNRQGELAQHLAISTPRLKQALAEARGCSIETWSLSQFGEYLDQALQRLDYPDPPVCVRVEGRVLIQGSDQVRLSQQQVRFVNLLTQRCGQWVEYADFHKVGVLHPENIKNKLLMKLKKKGVVLPIDSRPGGYRLPEATS